MSFLIEKAAFVLGLDLRGEIRREFGFGDSGRRMRLRRALQQALRRRTGRLFPESLDLLKPPLKFEDLFVSLSHAKGIGGFVLSRGCPVGFDIEESSRFERHQTGAAAGMGGIFPPRRAPKQSGRVFPPKSLQRRILRSEEEAMIEVSRLWCLKEAALKALSARAAAKAEKQAGEAGSPQKPARAHKKESHARTAQSGPGQKKKLRAAGPKPAGAAGGEKKRKAPAGGLHPPAEKLFLRDIAVREAGAGAFQLSLRGEIHGAGAAFQARGFTAAFAKFEL